MEAQGQQTKYKKNRDTILGRFTQLVEDLRTENELSDRCKQDTVKLCKIGFRKLLLAKKFSQIDEVLLELSSDKSNNSTSEFFSDILLFEAKRLAFKEEAIRCQSQNQIQV